MQNELQDLPRRQSPNWDAYFKSLNDEQLNKVAVLRVMECTNGVIQYAFRDNESYALDADMTRAAMQFSVGSIKRMAIEFEDQTITFEPDLEEKLREIRELYIRGAKRGDDEAYREFLRVSRASAIACGEERLKWAVKFLEDRVPHILPPHALKWGYAYLAQFL